MEGETYKVEDLGFVVDTVKYKDFLKQKEYNVLEAKDGEEALDIFGENIVEIN